VVDEHDGSGIQRAQCANAPRDRNAVGESNTVASGCPEVRALASMEAIVVLGLDRPELGTWEIPAERHGGCAADTHGVGQRGWAERAELANGQMSRKPTN
jgi:hypothetical protein